MLYDTGFDFWRDLCKSYGDDAVRIANSYLDLQIHNDDPDELVFCRQLYSAMKGV